MDRKRPILRHPAILIALLMCVWPLFGQTLKLQLDGDQVRLVAPEVRFISADARQILHDGSTVTYSFRINISTARNSIAATSITYHCVLSYDIWEERYKVSRSEPGARSASNLTEDAAQKQCIDSLTIPVTSLSPDSAFWLSIEYRMEDRHSTSNGDERTWLGTFVEIFSQRKEKPQATGTLQGGPFRISELRKR